MYLAPSRAQNISATQKAPTSFSPQTLCSPKVCVVSKKKIFKKKPVGTVVSYPDRALFDLPERVIMSRAGFFFQIILYEVTCIFIFFLFF